MIKSLVFDFGDVFLTLDKSATQKNLQKFGITEFTKDMLVKNQAYEMGLISTQDIIEYYTTHFPQISQLDFIHAWNSILIDFPPHKLDFIKTLAQEKSFQLILLSNTNHLHIEWVKENIEIYNEFKNCFDAFYLSHEIELRKPSEAIFKYVLTNHDLKPEETLFIDDTLEHIKAASQLGIKTWHLQAGKEDVVDLFKIKRDLLF
ncbi:HAD-IA family hydrolase [Psychroflexus maritimus]|uniref:HAD-IA family hydrolase n=1 Tax=Psychroflexus maritimus TaxID=2714865 RepID=A0A967AGN8_9FLAO|nr:HAD-IA family hydrolase [Psychroflexus maritimus]NGZ90913.1 HAD-IA family hydrolase [Psychroflexus maritimus]